MLASGPFGSPCSPNLLTLILANGVRDRALFGLAIDSKLRGCDLLKPKIGTPVSGPAIRTRAMVVR